MPYFFHLERRIPHVFGEAAPDTLIEIVPKVRVIQHTLIVATINLFVDLSEVTLVNLVCLRFPGRFVELSLVVRNSLRSGRLKHFCLDDYHNSSFLKSRRKQKRFPCLSDRPLLFCINLEERVHKE